MCYDSAVCSNVVRSSVKVESASLGVRDGDTRAGSDVVNKSPLFNVVRPLLGLI